MSGCGTIVVKLGGSAITDKSGKYAIKTEVLEEIAEAIADYISRGGRIAIVHGGGSFGHYEVESIHAEKGLLETQDSARVQLAMLKLAVRVLDLLVGKGVPAILHPPHSLCVNGKASQCRYSIVVKDFDLHLVPVMYGDAIPTEDGVKVLSGDDIAAALASILKSDCLVYVIDEKGILDKEGKIISEIKNIKEVPFRDTTSSDVTGGLRHKLEVALNLAASFRGKIVITDVSGFKKILSGTPPEKVGSIIRGRGED